MRNMIIAALVFLVITLVFAQSPPPNGVLNVGSNPAGYCAAQTAPTAAGNVTGPFICMDAGGLYFGNSGQKFVLISNTGGAPGNNCAAFKVNTVNTDGSWNVTCTSAWH